MRNLLLTPLRLAVGWGISPRVLGFIGVTMLVLLRMTIGWHFHSEGSAKYREGNWDATPFFANAKGPFADDFRKLVWDYDGAARRNPEYTKWRFEQFRDEAALYYQFGDVENKAADAAVTQAMKAHAEILEDYSEDLEEYDLGVLELADLKQDKARQGVESLAGQVRTVEKETDAKLKPALAEFNKLWDSFEISMNALAAPNQREVSPPLKMVKFRIAMEDKPAPLVDTSIINRWVPFFDLIVGWCLLLGLFTPIAALAAAGFLGSVFLSQYPPTTGPSSSMYQLIEAMACLVLAGTGAGRFAGLDFFIHLLIRKSEADRALEND